MPRVKKRALLIAGMVDLDIVLSFGEKSSLKHLKSQPTDQTQKIAKKDVRIFNTILFGKDIF